MSKSGLFPDDGRRYCGQDQAFIECVRVTQKGYRPVTFGYCSVFQYGDDLRFPSYCWDRVLSLAVHPLYHLFQ